MAIRVVSIISRMNIGGPAKLIADLINHLPEDEIEHILITGRCESDETDLLDSYKIKSQVIYLDDVSRSIFLFKDIKSFIKLFFLLRKLQPEIVHTHLSKAGVLGRLATKIVSPRITLIHTFHGHLLSGYFSQFKVTLIIQIEKFLSSFTDILIAVSKDVKDKYSKLGIGNRSAWEVINPGIRIPARNEPEKRIIPKAKLKKVNIIWIGRFAEIKNPKFALEVFSLLQSKTDNSFNLTMVGDGKLLEECKEYSNARNLGVIFTGWLPNASIELANSDILLFTSENEGFGMVVVEAALNGVLVISTNSGGVTDFIKHNQTGLIVSSEASNFVDAISRICSQSEKFEEIVKSARNLAISEFSADIYVAKHLDLYREIIKKSS